ncbi:MAG: hypothetical protein M0041_07885 [Nitrospiraceae bacterium]|nr:hypothetical protein [Nitrospiraceae bacterium]
MQLRNTTSVGRILSVLLIVVAILSGGCSRTSSDGRTVPGKVVGTVVLDPKVPLWMTHGSLAVVALMKGPTSPDWLPVARVVFVHPTFPVPFEISQKDVRLTGITFQGNVRLVARLSLESGSSLVTSGEYSGTAPVDATVGGSPVRIVIDRKLPTLSGNGP